MKRLGLIVNPIAGLGGRVGLKGTDGLAQKALDLGAKPQAGARAVRALAALVGALDGEWELVTAPGPMGETAAQKAGISPRVIARGPSGTRDSAPGETQARDSREAARAMAEMGVDLLLFAGGDGTARDICAAVGTPLPCLGIPAGVKIHSPVFARSPEAAGELAGLCLTGEIRSFPEQEVLDIDEQAYRDGRVTTRLFGYLSVPESGTRTQGRKAGTPLSERAAQNLISLAIVDQMEEDQVYLVGPGTTLRPVMEQLGLENSLLGVDAVCNGKLLGRDLGEKQILELVAGRRFKIVVTPIGGQGYLFGRGNHQFSPEILRQAGRENLMVGATLQKVGSLRGEGFLVDTGDPAVDEELRGYIRVITGYRQEMIHPIN